MFKRVLISFLSVLLILILATGVFSYFINICDRYLLPENSDTDLTVDYLFSIDSQQNELSGKVAVIGKDIKADKNYCMIYSSEGKILSKNFFGDNKENFIIHDIRIINNKIAILCTDGDVPLLYAIEVTSQTNFGGVKIEKVLTLEPSLGEDMILKLIFPDEKGEFIAVAAKEKTLLYDMRGQLIREYSYSPKNVITTGVYAENTFVLCGAASASEDGEGFSYGSVEAFDDSGKSVWSRDVYRENNCVSAVMECQMNSNGNLMLYGRFYDYSESDLVMTTLDEQTIKDFKMYGHGISYYIYTKESTENNDGIARPSTFIAEMDLKGNEKKVNVYSALNDYRVPSISQEKSLDKLNSNGEFILTTAQAASLSADSYFLTIDKVSVEIPCNIHVIYDVDSNGGIYAYLTESSAGVYKMKYFSTVAEFSDGMRELDRALYVSGILDYVPDVLPWGIVCVVLVILLIAKHKWRNVDCE